MHATGRQLAKGTNRFGELDEESESSLIHIHRIDATHARVRVLDAVGMIATPTLQLEVAPKIPADHLLHILKAANIVPRLAEQQGGLAADENLAVLISHWFLLAVEQVLEEGLAHDYRLQRDEITAIRGRIAPLETARLYYRGRLAVVAEFEEFDFDTPLNRLLLHAARIIAAGSTLPDDLRRRAIRAAKRMDGVGEFEHSDLLAIPDRRTAHYRDSTMLSKEIIRSAGRALEAGSLKSGRFSFAPRSPSKLGSERFSEKISRVSRLSTNDQFRCKERR